MWLYDTKVSDAGLVHLKGLKQLYSLGLSNTRVTGAGLVRLKDLKELETLDLDGLKVSDADLAQLKDLPELNNLSLYQSQVNDAGLEQLRALEAGMHISVSLIDAARLGVQVDTPADLARARQIAELHPVIPAKAGIQGHRADAGPPGPPLSRG